MKIPKWMKRSTAPSEPISKIEMIHTDLCEAEDDVREFIDKIENVKPTCLRRDEAKINTLSHRLDGVRKDRDLLRDMNRAAITTALNRFPLNTPCTLHTISNAIGIIDYEVERVMIRTTTHTTRRDVEKTYEGFKRPVYDACISPDGTHSLEDRYENGERDYHDAWRVWIIKIPGWRFVRSEFAHLYIERFK